MMSMSMGLGPYLGPEMRSLPWDFSIDLRESRRSKGFCRDGGVWMRAAALRKEGWSVT